YGYPQARIERDFNREAAHPEMWLLNTAGIGGSSTVPGPGRVDALTGIANREFAYDLLEPTNAIRGTAPTSFPPLWDIWRFDWVQYNSSVRSPMGRNVGESLGVGVRTHLVDANGKLNPEPLRYESSLRVHSLYAIEQQLAQLRAPVWPANLLGRVDPAQAKRGRTLFDQYCSRCHGVSKIEGTSPTEWAVHTIPYKVIGTDPEEVLMFAGSRFDGSKLGLGTSVPGVIGIAKFTGLLLGEAYKRAGITTPQQIAKYNGWGRVGYPTAPCGYKARPLVGIWATPPFLHNGSVPSIYDLLSDTRPAHPILGNTEYDPVKLGTVQQSAPGTMTLDTSKLGNSNAGHWFTNDRSRPGRIGPALAQAQKYDLIAYLKIASYGNYPATTVKSEFPKPCNKNFDWANGKVSDLRLNAP
ncbi:MAG TPA: di-heme-cytochrome C peroxidase, partial [Candidatus Baltobacteraceae bacterium]|nr:di-heme-cytochrome C peroxidase [Candidatus Baltobacteraceae bacterium]